MSAIYDNWERLVAAVIKKQQLWELFHEQSRSPSILSDASSSLSSPSPDLSFHDSSPPQLVLLSDFSPPLDIEQADRASMEFLGRGTIGSAYVATMNDGKRFVVKRLKSVDISEVDFKRLLEVAGDVRHENVVALRAYYSSSSPPHKLLLYDYYCNGSVYSLLFGENRGDVEWETRVRIAVGAARGIAQIHTQLLVHGNIKSSNILLDQHLYGCVSDLGFTNTTKTTFMTSAEVKNTTQNIASQASDVYSFGILLLQLLTRKSSSTGTDLVKLVGSVKSKESASKVFDPDLMKDPSIKEQMVEMLQIGMRCVAKSSKKRPNMSEVVKMLGDIKVTSNSLERKHLFLEDASPTFELKQLLMASTEWLGKGSFGSSYKATIDNGNYIVVVKMLKSLTATFMDFHRHMQVFARINHTNVSRLNAHFCMGDKKLLVYDYFNQGSLSAVLQGTSLDWHTRVKIAVGAARGIAQIHTQNGGRLVLGNIKSSNILIKGQDCCIGFDAGLPNLIEPERPPPTPGYSAPEASSGGVSQASDVYSFGVVLLELVSGKPTDSLVEWVRSVDRSEWGTQVLDMKCCGKGNEEEMMVQVLQIAMRCVSFVPELRPTIFGVVKELESVEAAIHVLDDDKMVLNNRWEESSIQSRLEWVLEDLLPMLSP